MPEKPLGGGAFARTTHSEVNSDLPEREIREFRQKPESPASQIACRTVGQALIIALMSLSRSILRSENPAQRRRLCTKTKEAADSSAFATRASPIMPWLQGV